MAAEYIPLIAAGISALGSVAGISASSNLNSRNRVWQSSEAAKSRAWQSNEALLNRTWQRDFYDYMFTKESKYNSPFEEMKRYRAAGINPYVLSGGAASVQSGNVNVPSPSSPSAPSAATAGTPVTYDVGSQLTGLVNSFAAAYKNINDARKAGAETQELQRTMDSVVRKASADADYVELQNELTRTYGDSKYKKEIDYLAAQISLAWSQAAEAERNADFIMQKGHQVIADMELKKAEKIQLEETLPLIKRHYEAQINSENEKAVMYHSQGKAAEAAAVSSYASASQAVAQARQINELTPVIKNLYENNAEMSAANANKLYVEIVDKALDMGIKLKTMPASIQKAYNEAKHGNMQNFVDSYNYLNGYLEDNAHTIPFLGPMIKFGK